ncbi:MAG: SIS domain-containing protein, partial [Chloroflexi bacterium]|nr:SIS domain-containing protein [Chloroflexota bacterium]
LIARYWIESLARVPVDVDIASEFRYRQPPLTPGGAALFISQSGETADTEDRRHKLIVTYTDQNQVESDIAWTKSFVGNNDSDDLLEVGERAELTVDLEALAQANPLVKNIEFSLELRPNEGSALVIEKRMPSKIDVVMNLQ